MKTEMKTALVAGICALLGGLIGAALTGYFGFRGTKLEVAQAAESMAAQSAREQSAMFADQVSRHIGVVVEFRFLVEEASHPSGDQLRNALRELEKSTYVTGLYGGADFLKATVDLHNALLALCFPDSSPRARRWATMEDAYVLWLRVARGEMGSYGAVALPKGKPGDKDIGYLREALRGVRQVQAQQSASHGPSTAGAAQGQ